jgi:hypothetical protein
LSVGRVILPALRASIRRMRVERRNDFNEL